MTLATPPLRRAGIVAGALLAAAGFLSCMDTRRAPDKEQAAAANASFDVALPAPPVSAVAPQPAEGYAADMSARRERAADGERLSLGAGAVLGRTVTAASAAAPKVAPRAEPQLAPGDATVLPSMVIRMGQASVQVDSVDLAIALVRRLAQQLGGYVASSTLQSGNENVRAATLEVKIPAARFDEAVGGLAPIGKVESVNVSAEDVGEEFVDVTARVANARRLETRLIDLLANRTGKLQEVLQVERELARVREEIERYEGRLRYLRTRSAVSTLTVTVHERAPVLLAAGHNPIAEAFRDAWRNFVGFTAGLIAAMGVVLPLAALAGLVAWLGRRYLPRRAPAAAAPATLPPPAQA